MKKIVMLMFVAAASLSFAACNSTGSENAPKEGADSTAVEVVEADSTVVAEDAAVEADSIATTEEAPVTPAE